MKSWLDRLVLLVYAFLLAALLGRTLGIIWAHGWIWGAGRLSRRLGGPFYSLGLIGMMSLWRFLLWKDRTDPERMARILVADYWRRRR